MFTFVDQKISAARNIFITSHKNCPDATGSVCALMEFLNARGKNVYSYLAEPVLKNLRYLPGSGVIQTKIPALENFDLFFIVDAGDLKQTGIPGKLEKTRLQNSRYCIINVDHHKTNDHFGDINIVDANASSTCEILHGFFEETGAFIGPKAANCLLTGIIGDTGNFTNGATTKKSLKIAADLISQGANIFQIIQNIVSTEASINTLRLWGAIFERLTYNKKYDIAVSYVLQKDLIESGTSEEAVEIVSNLLNYIRGINAGIFIKETQEGAYKVSMRSTNETVDLALLARAVGGGGHKKAAGFTVNKL